jgi:hypothetical protein
MKTISLHNAARIMVIDNDPRVCEDLQSTLKRAGYDVRVLSGIGDVLIAQAEAEAQVFRPHILIVDLHLSDDHNPSDDGGFRLFAKISSPGNVLYSAYIDPAISRFALNYKLDWVGKEERLEVLMEKIKGFAETSCAHSDTFKIKYPPVWSSEQIIKALFNHSKDIPPTLVDDLLRQLFPTSKEIRLDIIDGAAVTPDSVSRGHSVVLKVSEDDNPNPRVLKLARADKINQETRNYSTYINNKLRGHYYAELENSSIFWDIGAVVYKLLRLPNSGFLSFHEFYTLSSSTDKICRPLHHFFEETWRPLYEKSDLPPAESLFTSYDRIFDLTQRLLAFPNQNKEYSFDGCNLQFANPVTWLLNHKGFSNALEARERNTHGDLHGDNIFVGDGHAWAIDFERSGPGHILRDFVELEIDIITRLAHKSQGGWDNNQLFRFSVALLEPHSQEMDYPLAEHLLRDPESYKAYQVIRTLRQIALEVTRFTDIREYIWALLFDAVFVSTLEDQKSPQRERALLYGAVICRRLREWGNPWPPEEWKHFLAPEAMPAEINVAEQPIPSSRLSTQPTSQEVSQRSDAQPTSLWTYILGGTFFAAAGTAVLIALWWAMNQFSVTLQQAFLALAAVSVFGLLSFVMLRLLNAHDAVEAILQILAMPLQILRAKHKRKSKPKGHPRNE